MYPRDYSRKGGGAVLSRLAGCALGRRPPRETPAFPQLALGSRGCPLGHLGAVESRPLSSNSRPAAAPRSRLQVQPVELLASHPPPLSASCAPREGTPLLSPQVTSAPAPSPPWRCEFQQQTQASRCRLCHFAKGGSEKERNKGRGPRKQIQITNGPCPLLAIMNILFLQWKVKLPPQKEVITSDELLTHLGNCLLSIKPQEKSEGLQLNFQQNVDDAMTVLPKLATGLDVNVRFTGVSDFEYTPECSIFDLLGIPLYHGWLVDPQSPEAVSAVGKLSYNQLVEKIITCKHSSDSNLVTEGLVAEQFLETTAAQLTYHGLCELTAAATEDELSVFFRNNHFSTMTKHKSHLYLLVTDQGFLQEEQVVWESLHNVDGDSCFCDSDFHLSHSLGKSHGAEGGGGSPEKQLQVDQDYLIALSLQQQQQPQGTLGLSDLELAQQLQQEEYQQQQAVQPVRTRAPSPQGRGATSGRPAGERRQRSKTESDCVLL